MTPRAVAPYPWAALERVPRLVARGAGRARRAVERAAVLERLGPALSELLSSEVAIVVREVGARTDLVERQPCRAALELADGSAHVVVGMEPALATAAIARLLGRQPSVGPTGAPLDSALSGALAALLIEAARRAGGELPLRLGALPAHAGAEPGISVRATVLLDGRPYDAVALVRGAAVESEPLSADALGELPLALRLVVALSSAEPAELAELRPGSAWMPGAGWWIDAGGSGSAVLAAPGGERGVGVDLTPDGAMVVREARSLESETVDSMTDDVSQTAAEAALDAPVVVRVEMGAVSMTAREWAGLRPGDVIETGRRIAEPVVLRIAGRVVARGELVDVEGELGVRIRELLAGGQSP